MKKQREKKKSSIIWILSLLSAVVIGIILIPDKLQTKTPVQVTKPAHNEAELHIFWDTELKTLIEDQLENGTTPFTEINTRFLYLRNDINKETHKPLAVLKSTNYHWLGKEIEASTGMLSDGTVNLEFYVPALKDAYVWFQSSKRPSADWKHEFQVHVLIDVMHEMEHTKDIKLKNRDHIDIIEEERAWNDTCRYTVVPLAKIYHLPMFDTEATLCGAWNLAEGNPQDQRWKEAMKKVYGNIDGKKYPN